MASEDADRQLAMSLSYENEPPDMDNTTLLPPTFDIGPVSPSFGVGTSHPPIFTPVSPNHDISLPDPVTEPPVVTAAPINNNIETSNSVDCLTQTGATPYRALLKCTKESLGPSDMTVFCGTESWEVHRACVCHQSKFFAAAVEGGFTESRSGSLDLKEEHPQIVQRLMTFFYYGDYGDLTPVSPPLFFVHKTGGSTMTDQDRQDSLLLHCAMYACAVRYHVAELKTKAEGRFKALVASSWPLKDLPALVADVYTSTPSNDRGLRDPIVALCSEHIDDLVKDPSWQELTKVEAAAQLSQELLPMVIATKNEAIQRLETRPNTNAGDCHGGAGSGGGGRKKKRKSCK
ncbi:MAG: hypothetical protein Q9206_003426 [Seirophora lacunosa]